MSDACDPRQFVRRVPKAEIHLHLEGSIALPTLLRIACGAGGSVDPAHRARLEGLYAHRDFPAFLKNFRKPCGELRRPADLATITEELSRRHQEEGVRYSEVLRAPHISRPP